MWGSNNENRRRRPPREHGYGIHREREHNVDDVDNDADNDTEEVEEDMPDVQLALDQI